MHRQLVVVADDFGLTSATSRSIVDAHRRGLVTAVSILGNGPTTERDLALLDEVPRLEAGLHLALVGEDPPRAEARMIPTLVDRRGHLARSWRHLLPLLVAGRVDPDDVGRELAAQLEVITSRSVPLTHLNAHQHLHLWPSIAPVVVATAQQHGIGYVRTPRSSTGLRGRAVDRLAGRLTHRVASAGLATSDGFVGLDEAGTLTGARLLAALGRTGAPVVEVNAHPGAADDAERARYAWGYRWAEEHAALTDAQVAGELAEAGWVLARPSEVARRVAPDAAGGTMEQ